LKQKLLEGGFDEREVNETVVELDKRQPQQPPKMGGMPPANLGLQRTPATNTSPQLQQGPQPENKGDSKPLPKDNNMGEKKEGMVRDKKGSGKWIKIGAWIGVVMLILALTLVILQFVLDGGLAKILSGTIILSVFLVFFILLFFLYYFGFYKIGQHVDSGKLRFSSISIVILLLIIMALALVGQMMASDPLGGLSSSQKIIAYSDGGLIFILMIMQLIFSIGLVGIKDKVKYSKADL